MAKNFFKRPIIALLAAVFAIALFARGGDSASAKSVSVGSLLFTNMDNVTISGTKTGLKLYSTGKRDTSAQFGKKLLFKDFELVYILTQSDFSAVYFEILGENGSAATGNISDEDRKYRLTITKKEGQVTATVSGKGFDPVSSDVEVSFTEETTLKIVGGDDDGDDFYTLKFRIENSSGEKAATIEKEISVYRAEGTLTIGFEGIEVGKAAEMYIKRLNGQSFISSTEGYVDDNVAPVMRMETDKLIDIAPLSRAYELPVYGIDVLSSTIKYNIKWEYSADGSFDEPSEIEKTENLITFDKAGYYRVKEIKINDDNGNETTDCIDYNYKEEGKQIKILVETWSNASPQLVTFEDPDKRQEYITAIETVYNGGNSHKFQFAAPEVKVNSNPSGTENPKLVKFKLKYKTVGLTTWSEVDGLVFTANTADKEYEFQIKATDRAGNSIIYELTEKDHVKITFRDVTPPKINVSWFESERYLDQAVSLPSASATDDLDSSPKTSVKVYYIMDEKGQPVYEKDEEGNIVYEDEDKTIPKKVLVSESTSFTPDKVGWYEVIYTAEDREGHVTASPPYTFKVVKASDTPKEPIIDLSNTWNIVFLSIAGVCALGLIIIPFIKPKEE
jgi:hypothetical protein